MVLRYIQYGSYARTIKYNIYIQQAGWEGCRRKFPGTEYYYRKPDHLQEEAMELVRGERGGEDV